MSIRAVLGGLVAGGLSRVEGTILTPPADLLTYGVNADLPVVIPPAQGMLLAALQGRIPDRDAAEVARLHGIYIPSPDIKEPKSLPNAFKPDLVKWWQSYRDSQANQFDVGTVYDLVNRGIINTKQGRLLLKAAGYFLPNQVDFLMQLRWNIPGVGALVDFGALGLGALGDKPPFPLAAEFERLWDGPLREALLSNGVNESWAKYYWAAHWTQVPLSTLWEAGRRLRFGRVPAELRVLPDDITALERMSGVHPWWRDRLQKLSEKLLPQRWIRASFTVDAIPEAEVTERYRDFGFDVPTALAMTQLEIVQKARTRAQQSQGYTTSRTIQLYSESEIDDTIVIAKFKALGYSAQEAKDAMALADSKLFIKQRRAQRACIYQEYLHGQIDDITAFDQMRSIGYPGGRIANDMRSWPCERERRRPHLTLATLKQWLKLGAISLDDFHARILLIGWHPDDALRITVVAALELELAQLKDLAKLQKQVKRAAIEAFRLRDGQEKANLVMSMAELTAKELEDLDKLPKGADKTPTKAAFARGKAKLRSDFLKAQAAAKAKVDALPPI